MSRFDVMNEVGVPDQWDDIRRRAEDGELLELSWEGPRGRRLTKVAPVVAVAAAVLLVAVVVGIDRRSDVATSPASTADGLPDLACASGELLDGSLPDHASPTAEGLEFELDRSDTSSEPVKPVLVRSWQVDAVRIQLAVPGFPWNAGSTDGGERIRDPEGTLARRPAAGGATVFVGSTGLDDPCARVEIEATGGDEEERVAAALEVARSLRWEPAEPVLSSAEVDDVASMRRYALSVVKAYMPPVGAQLQVAVVEWTPGDDVPTSWTAALPRGSRTDGRYLTAVLVAEEPLFVAPTRPGGGPGDDEGNGLPQPSGDVLTITEAQGSDAWDWSSITSGADVERSFVESRDDVSFVPALVENPIIN